MSQFNQNASFSGLNTFLTSAPNTDNYVMAGTVSLPGISKGDSTASTAVITVTQNSVTKYTGPAGAEGFKALLNCTAGDVIAVTLSSSATVDARMNRLRTTINFSQGPY